MHLIYWYNFVHISSKCIFCKLYFFDEPFFYLLVNISSIFKHTVTWWKIIYFPQNSKKAWVQAVLSWLYALLEYKIIDSKNKHMRLVYSVVFNILPFSQYAHFCSGILYHITIRSDVTPLRVKKLLAIVARKNMGSWCNKLLR